MTVLLFWHDLMRWILIVFWGLGVMRMALIMRGVCHLEAFDRYFFDVLLGFFVLQAVVGIPVGIWTAQTGGVPAHTWGHALSMGLAGLSLGWTVFEVHRGGKDFARRTFWVLLLGLCFFACGLFPVF